MRSRFLGLGMVAWAMTGCWAGTASVNYARHHTYNNLPPGTYQEVGQVQEKSWAHYAGFCGRATENVMEDALTEAKNMGGNALTDVKWITDDGTFDRPTCESAFAFYWWGASAELTARAVKVEPETLARLEGGTPRAPDRAPEPEAIASALMPAPQADTDGQKAWAVVVGIGRYQEDLPEAAHAEDDARAFAAYAEHTLGVPPAHIKLLTGERAGRAALNSMLEEWLPRNAREPGGRVYFFFSGHGAPDPTTGDAYLVPWDADPAFLKTRGVGLAYLYERLGALEGQETVVFLDSCFSGSGQRSVLAKGTRPLVPVQTPRAAGRVMALTAAGARETTGAARDLPHGLFTRYLLGGLGGAADADEDGTVSLGELADYVGKHVAEDARLDNRDQTPDLQLPPGLRPAEVRLVQGLH